MPEHARRTLATQCHTHPCLRRRPAKSEAMGKTYDTLPSDLQDWIAQQKVFFVSTAPSGDDGHINCSPKGSDSFRILNDREVAYLDFTGSGIETISHVQQNGRIVIMFCAFEGPPKIARIHGIGEVVYPTDSTFAELSQRFPENPGTRAIIKVKATRISDSCGYTVPFMDFVKPREALDRWAEKKTPAGLVDYRRENNRTSIDGIPGYPAED